MDNAKVWYVVLGVALITAIVALIYDMTHAAGAAVVASYLAAKRSTKPIVDVQKETHQAETSKARISELVDHASQLEEDTLEEVQELDMAEKAKVGDELL
jgi:hypothetical protein